MNEECEFITHDFKLPNHENELSKVEDVIEKLKQKITISEVTKMTDKQFIETFEEVIRALDYVGKLSLPVFTIEDQMQAMYSKQYVQSPALAKELWLNHYGNVHRPYNILKNRCFKLLDELDDLYVGIHDKKPPNWKI